MIFNIQPATDIKIARRQANCFDRALTMEAQGYAVEVNDALQSGICYFVTNPEGVTYTVDPLLQTCNCPDFENRGDFCKHTMFVNLWNQKQEDLRDEAQVAAYEAELANCPLLRY